MVGVDEAGRGSVIGPLVVAGVLFDEDRVKKLGEIGVRDSKTLTPSQREKLEVEIKRLALKFKVVEVPPKEIDKVVFRGKKMFKLNWLEAKVMAEVIEELNPDIAYVDASDINAERFGEQIRGMLKTRVKVVSEHKADEKYLVVGAASIVAKVHRDRIIARLKEEYGDFGCGYSHDPKTIRFLREWFRSRKDYPYFLRRSWKTVEKVRFEVLGEQKKLEF
ncbi:MAG: ribonuclease HII [Candidatus Hecatellales archaeon]|nr:MAG: ribonuclease HII [Candidatus Hecatellales archaeon]